MFNLNDIQVRPAFTIEKLDRRLLLSADAGVEEEVVVCDRTVDWGIVEEGEVTDESLIFETMILTLDGGGGDEMAYTCGFEELPAEGEDTTYDAEILTAVGEGEELMYTCGFGELPLDEEAPLVDVEGEYEVEILVIDESAELVDPIDGWQGEVEILVAAPGAESGAVAEEPAAGEVEIPEVAAFASLDSVASLVLDSQSDDVLA